MGRPYGSVNRNKTESAAFARQIVEDPEYRTSLRARAIAGTLPPAVENLLWYYAFGRPVERALITEVSVTAEELSTLSREQLALRAERVVRLLRERTDDDDDDDNGGVH